MTSRLLGRFFPPFVLLLFAAVALAVWTTNARLQSLVAEQFHHNFALRGQLVGEAIRAELLAGNQATLQLACERMQELARARVTLFSTDGEVLCDSQQALAATPTAGSGTEPARAQLSAQQASPESVATSLASHRAIEPGPSASADGGTLHWTVPLVHQGRALGVARLSVPAESLSAWQAQVRWQVALAGLLMGVACAAAGLAMLRRVQAPLELLRRGAQRFALGDLSQKLETPPTEEMYHLAIALNQMAQLLEDRIGHIARKGHEQDAVLASMVEGVLAVDRQERVISLNQAGGNLLSCDPALARGRGLQEVIRNADLRRFVSRTIGSNEPIEDDVILRNDEERILQARGASLRDVQGHSVGAVVVLNEVTHVRKLENLRRDFVANVSHELRTPITSIKGFVETLLDGALQNPADAERFLKIVARQADRLNSIIEDLLALAKIEQSVDAAEAMLQEAMLAEVLQSAVDEYAAQAAQRQITIRLSCPPQLRAKMNTPLIEQALLNLLDNAVKYSEPGSEVHIEALQQDRAVVIHVHDQGCGIAEEHHSRLFERFYRVDKARSRKLGGTGLGLSIVKHILHVHGGRVTVRSSPGRGSTFSIWLPLTPAIA